MPDLSGVLARTPAPRIFERLRRGLRVLAYHGVPDRVRFATQLDLLMARYTPVGLPEVEACLHEGAALPDRAVLITFDDGDPSVIDHALPELRHRAIPAVLYVVASLIDSEQPFWWDEVASLVPAEGAAAEVRELKMLPDSRRRERIAGLRQGAPQSRVRQLTTAELRSAANAGVVIGNHTSDHPCLDRCDPDEARAQVVDAHHRLSEILGHAPGTFAYPNGNRDPRVEPVLTDLAYRSGFLFDHRIQRIPAAHPHRLSRIRVGAADPVDVFRAKVSGVHSSVHHRIPGRA